MQDVASIAIRSISLCTSSPNLVSEFSVRFSVSLSRLEGLTSAASALLATSAWLYLVAQFGRLSWSPLDESPGFVTAVVPRIGLFLFPTGLTAWVLAADRVARIWADRLVRASL